MSIGRMIDPFKMSKVSEKILDLMEKEGMNEAEAESMPEYLKSKIVQNSERKNKCKPFTVYKE